MKDNTRENPGVGLGHPAQLYPELEGMRTGSAARTEPGAEASVAFLAQSLVQ